jgi:FkbM family methyltransferase
MLSTVRMLLGFVPASFISGGRADALALRTLDPLFSRMPTARIQTRLGSIELDMRHEPQRLMAYCYYNLRRHYARSALGRYIRQLEPGTTFADVGGNLGFYSLLAREAGLHAMCFEPEPRYAEYLQRNREVFGKIFPVALSDESGSLPLYYFPGNPGATSLVPRKWSSRSTATVPVRTFSDLALDGELGDPARIALVKIDVEGAEAAAVRGMSEFLSAGHRPDIWCEVRGNGTGRSQGSFALVRNALQEFGYLTFDAPEMAAPRPAPDDDVLGSRRIFDLLFRVERPDRAASTQSEAA